MTPSREHRDKKNAPSTPLDNAMEAPITHSSSAVLHREYSKKNNTTHDRRMITPKLKNLNKDWEKPWLKKQNRSKNGCL